jgi:hypothetical protein
MSDVKGLLQEKDQKILELEQAFQAKDKLIRPQHLDTYYTIDNNGEPIGTPLCLGCLVKRKKQYQLAHLSDNFRIHVCTSCGHKYEVEYTQNQRKKTHNIRLHKGPRLPLGPRVGAIGKRK